MRRILDEFLEHRPRVIDECLAALGSDAPDVGPSDETLNELRPLLARHFDITDVDAVTNDDVTSPIRAGLLKAWGLRASDPGVVAADWLQYGAPAGILDMPLLAGVFPLAAATEVPADPILLDDPADEFKNYAGIDNDDDVKEQVADFVQKGYL